ncbi:MAG: radical SAM protein [Prevotellaceae bacterium]|jgi:biotin synthase|nr:radical SAM protein [Prevotellaceae bacterium]
MEAFEKLIHGQADTLTVDEIAELLGTDTRSDAFYELVRLSNRQSRSRFGDHGYVFAQIGINAQPCPVNCKFCSMGAGHYVLDMQGAKSVETICEEVRLLERDYFDDFFLMTTANYPQEQMVEIGRAVKPLLRSGQRFVANIGDFDLDMALRLKEAGFTGAYHINRLREGTDTLVKPEQREATLRAINEAGLELYYCIEPIGPEHSYRELAVEIARARDLHIAVMAAMRRTPVPGTPLYSLGQISAPELTKIVAVTNLVVRPSRAMNVHEPTQAALLAGVNQLYAEVGANPRDTDSHTEQSRGFNIQAAWQMLAEFGYQPLSS